MISTHNCVCLSVWAFEKHCNFGKLTHHYMCISMYRGMYECWIGIRSDRRVDVMHKEWMDGWMYSLIDELMVGVMFVFLDEGMDGWRYGVWIGRRCV